MMSSKKTVLIIFIPLVLFWSLAAMTEDLTIKKDSEECDSSDHITSKMQKWVAITKNNTQFSAIINGTNSTNIACFKNDLFHDQHYIKHSDIAVFFTDIELIALHENFCITILGDNEGFVNVYAWNVETEKTFYCGNFEHSSGKPITNMALDINQGTISLTASNKTKSYILDNEDILLSIIKKNTPN